MQTAGMISIAGPSSRASDLIREQIETRLSYALVKRSDAIITELMHGRTVEAVTKELTALFRPAVQPYLISWSNYDPG